MRELIKSKQLKLRVEGGKLVLEPVNVDKYYGIFKNDLGKDVDIGGVIK